MLSKKSRAILCGKNLAVRQLCGKNYRPKSVRDLCGKIQGVLRLIKPH